MATINPNLVPTINPGDLFDEFTTDTSLNIRWLGPTDPAYYETLNRPLADIALRQLIIAKAVDNLNVSLGYQAIFPFIIPPQVEDGSTVVDMPIRVFWDMHASIPVKWGNLRLARIDRLDGENAGGSGSSASTYTGTLRFIFSANQLSGTSVSTAEIALFYADYEIDSDLTYQRARVTPATAVTVPGMTVLATGEGVTIDGEIVFRTLDQSETETTAFYDLLAPTGRYEMVDSVAGGSAVSPDYDVSSYSHGTGMLTSSAFCLITPVDSDPLTWLEAFNYPFDINATRTASDASGIVIPDAMFDEFDIVAPAGDEPTGDTSGAFFPVWINKIENIGDGSTSTLVFYFSTYGIDPVDPTTTVEFATLTLQQDMTAGEIVGIIPDDHLFTTKTSSNWHQEFGRGHVVVSSKWGIAGGEIDDFFNSIPTLVGSVSTITFGTTGTRISSRALSRVPKYSPTAGQAAALRGTSSERTTAIDPASSNRYVTELDEGLGDIVDLEAQTGIVSNDAVERYGYMATRSHKLIKLVVDPEKASEVDDPTFYADEILPRLRVLLERDPVFGDIWYNGNRFMTYNGDSWVG